MPDLAAQIRTTEDVQDGVDDAVQEADCRRNRKRGGRKLPRRALLGGHHLHDDEDVVRSPAEDEGHHNGHDEPNKPERPVAASVRQAFVHSYVTEDDD